MQAEYPQKIFPLWPKKIQAKGNVHEKKIDVVRKFPIHSPQPHNYSNGPSVIDGYRP